MTPILWTIALLIGAGFGFCWGYTARGEDTPTPDIGEDEARRQGYLLGWDECRENCMQLARANDFDRLERQIGASEPKR